MSKLFRDASVKVPCPNCGYKITQTIGRLQNNPQLHCPRCDGDIQVEASGLRKGLSSVDRAMDDLKRTIANFGKR